MEPTLPSPAPRPRSALPRSLKALAAAVGVAAALWGGALVALSRDAARAALRDRVGAALRARLPEATLGGEVFVDPLFRVTFGPLTVPAANPSDPPVLRVEHVKVRPRLLPLLAGRAEVASIRVYGVRIEAGRGGRALADLAARLERRRPKRPTPGAERAAADEDPADPPALHVRGAVVAITAGARDLAWGPIDADLERDRRGRAERLALDLRLPGGARARLAADRDPGGARGRLDVEGLGPAALPSGLDDLPVTLAGGTLALEAEGEAAADLSRATVQATLRAGGLSLGGPRIGAEPVGPLDAAAAGALRWDGATRTLALAGAKVTLFDALEAAVEGEVRAGPGLPFSLSVRAERVPFARAVAALPPALALPAGVPVPPGDLDGHLALSGLAAAPATWTVDAGLDLSRLRAEAKRAPPVALRAPFTYRPELEEGGEGPPIVVGPQNPDFVPFAELPNHVVRAVTTAEDAGFFGHPGLEFEELKNAFAQAARAGRVVRGGSTITQQLAKNLWLSREKTFARKVREAVAAVALEGSVPKARLLEIYLNVIEWGPGLWGIGPAARHWFGKDARALTPREAAFLASVIPNPVRYHAMWTRGATTEQWDQRVNELLLKMSAQRAIDDDTLTAALAQPLVFARPAAEPASATAVEAPPG